MRREVYLVLVEYGQAHERDAVALLLDTMARVLPSSPIRGVIVDNLLNEGADLCVGTGAANLCVGPGADTQVRPCEQVHIDFPRIAGDNTLHEFSGWDRGLMWLTGRYAPADDAVVVLANDTILRADKRHWLRDLTAARVQHAAEGALVGMIEEYPRPVELFGLAMRQFVDTTFVLTERRTLARLLPLARLADDAAIFGDDCEHFFRDPSPLSANYRAYLRRYFFGERIADGFEHDWYAQERLCGRNFGMFKSKLRCVFCEHLLSARARALHIPLADIRRRPLPIDPFEAPARRGAQREGGVARS